MLNKYKIIIDTLKQMYPDAKCELNHTNPYQLLVATILSAQSTDKRVNIVTDELFKTVSSPKQMITLGEEKLKEYIKSIGFYNAKSKNIISMSKDLIAKYDGQVPQKMEDLISLSGVGRKTANVVMSNCFGFPAIAVDTHVFRLSHRLGFSDKDDVYKVELDLQKKIAKKNWTLAHHLLIFHGRYCCKAQNPSCEKCSLKQYCLYYQKNSGKNFKKQKM